MAPSGKTTSSRTKTTTTAAATTRTTRRSTRTRHPRRTHFKKQQQQQKHSKSKKQETPTSLPSSCSSISSQDSSKEVEIDAPEVIDASNSACSTPKGQKFMIPEISTCPPAPKKPRVLSNCSLRRSPLSFFAPPDLELFFFMALRDVSV